MGVRTPVLPGYGAYEMDVAREVSSEVSLLEPERMTSKSTNVVPKIGYDEIRKMTRFVGL